MKVNPKENRYFAIKLLVSIVVYLLLFYSIFTLATSDNPKSDSILTIAFTYIGIILLFILVQTGLMIGHLKGNAIKITSKQFPDIYNILVKESEALGLTKIPDAYVWQQGGLLNAFTLKFIGTHYVVVYSDVLAEAYKKDQSTVEFIIGHELGHIKRKHYLKKLLLLPGSIIPFLGSAYSRACEYTADAFGAYLSPEGAVAGMTLLAAGPHLAAKVDTQQFILQAQTEDGFWPWVAEKTASHPNLTKRVAELERLYPEKPKVAVKSSYAMEIEENSSEIDHSKYMPN